jgi:hypothetical protein
MMTVLFYGSVDGAPLRVKQKLLVGEAIHFCYSAKYAT